MRKAAVSITNNIAEGYGRFAWQEKTHYFHISRGSTMEIVDDLNVRLDQKYAKPDVLQSLRDQAERVLQMLNGYIEYLQRSKNMA
jgi:four helix bundle protein